VMSGRTIPGDELRSFLCQNDATFAQKCSQGRDPRPRPRDDEWTLALANAIGQGRESFARRAWGKAYVLLSAPDQEASLAPEDLEQLAITATCDRAL
jgi:hypothetical protein